MSTTNDPRHLSAHDRRRHAALRRRAAALAVAGAAFLVSAATIAWADRTPSGQAVTAELMTLADQ